MSTEIEMRLVDRDAPRAEHNAVRRVDGRLARELSYEPFGWRSETAAKRPDWEAWLWGAEPLAGAIFVYGTTVADKVGGTSIVNGLRITEPMWTLDRMWVSPRLRRQGVLSAAWPVWRDRYGEFCVHGPSPALQAFLHKWGWETPRWSSATWHPPTHIGIREGF